MALDRKRSVRGSVRSRGSSSSGTNPREKLKDCCRQVVAFMFTQVGVGGLVISYAIMGAFAFMSIEGDEENQIISSIHHLRVDCVTRLWNVTDHYNVLHQEKWRSNVMQMLRDYQEEVALAVKSGYDGKTIAEKWTFPAALMFSLSVFTMIGFGHLVPRTEWGKIATMLYAVFGIPVYVLYFMNMGKVLAQTFKWIYCKIVRCAADRSKAPLVVTETSKALDRLEANVPKSSGSSSSSSESGEPIIVPSTACLWVMFIYLLTGTIMFAEWEHWDYLDACYFCVTSLCKIGIGDFVPGANAQAAGSQTKLIINFVYLLVGMGVIAMCYNLMKEEVLLRLRELKADLLEKLQDVGARMRS